MTTLRWAPIALAFLLVGTPLAAASDDGGGGLGCLNIVMSPFASGVRPILSISDAIAVGVQSNVAAPFAVVVIVIPALCDLPSAGDIIGQASHTAQANRATLPNINAGDPILP